MQTMASVSISISLIKTPARLHKKAVSSIMSMAFFV